MWRSRSDNNRKQRQQQRHSKKKVTATADGGKVGTEAKAIKNIEKNKKNFTYPNDGFVTHIEHSLLYNMLSEPKVYPEEVVLNQINEEDFTTYLLVNTPPSTLSSSNNATTIIDEEESRSRREEDSDISNHFQNDEENTTNKEKEEERISYAQLSAIVALSITNFPPPKNNSTSSNNNNTDDNKNNNNNNSIPTKLNKRVLQCIVKYAEQHDLNREVEIKELLDPVQRYSMKRDNKAALQQILPLYVGYFASIVTANPVPMLVGAAAMATVAGGDKADKERQNMQSVTSESNRIADVEKTSLLDEIEDE